MDKKSYLNTYTAAGGFTRLDLEKNKNWFYGLFRYLGRHLNLSQGQGGRALDVGCGIGAVSNLLAERGFEVYASDISKYAIDKARRLSPKVRFFNFNIQKGIPIKGKFDLITSLEVLEHLDEPKKAVKNIYEKLADGGFLICSTPLPCKYHLPLRNPVHVSVKSPKEWRKIFEEAGFLKKNLHIRQISFLPFLYRFHRFLSVVIPVGTNLPYIISPILIVAQK